MEWRDHLTKFGCEDWGTPIAAIAIWTDSFQDSMGSPSCKDSQPESSDFHVESLGSFWVWSIEQSINCARSDSQVSKEPFCWSFICTISQSHATNIAPNLPWLDWGSGWSKLNLRLQGLHGVMASHPWVVAGFSWLRPAGVPVNQRDSPSAMGIGISA